MRKFRILFNKFCSLILTNEKIQIYLYQINYQLYVLELPEYVLGEMFGDIYTIYEYVL